MLSKLCHFIVKYFALTILLLLSVISLISTQRYGIESAGEIVNGAPIYNVSDNPILNISAILVCALVFLLIRKYCKHSSPHFTMLIQISLAFLGGLLSFCMFNDGTRSPINDQIQVYSASLLFNEGNFINLSPGGYIALYPQQLGYVLYLQLLFRFFQTTGFQIIQLINCGIIVAILLAMFCFLNDLVTENSLRIAGSLFIAFSLPLYFLHTWVYGDLPFILFTFLFLHLYYKILEHPTIARYVGTLTCGCLMLVFRKNALVLLLAAFLVLLAHGILKKDRSPIIFGCGMLVLPLLIWNLLIFSYKQASSYEDFRGLPSTCWIAMGCIEDGSKPGWFNNYGVSTYYANGCDYDITASEATKMISERCHWFMSNPVDALSFWKRKICTQWNDPYFNTYDLIKTDTVPLTGLTALFHSHSDKIRTFLSIAQSICYIGACLYVMFAKHNNLMSRLPEVMLIGGFLFSILWEANSRYVYPYFLILLPLSMCGWNLLINIGVSTWNSSKNTD